jgi:hypothetical protein
MEAMGQHIHRIRIRVVHPWLHCAAIVELAKVLGVEMNEAIGPVVHFWRDAAHNCPDGFVGDRSDERLNAWAGYWRPRKGSRRYQFAAWARKHLIDADGTLVDWERIYPTASRREDERQEERRKINLKVRSRVMERDNFHCKRCGSGTEHGPLVVDHIHPVSLGGRSDMDNLQTLCRPCNSGKGARLPTSHDLKVVNGGLD